MKKASEKRYINKVNLAKNYNIFGIFCRTTKRHLRADGLSLLPSALRPRLVGGSGSSCDSRSRGVNVCVSGSRSRSKNGNGGSRITRHLHFHIPALAVIVLGSLVFSFLLQTSYALNASAASLTLTIPSNPLSLDLNPSSNNGFASTSGSFNVKTDNSSGYTVSIKSKNDSGDNSLINGSNKLTSIVESTTAANFKNDSKFLNQWGWLPSKLNSVDNTNYQIAPGTEEVILESTEEANNETGTNYNISLAAKVSGSMPTGTYSNTFVITSIANKPKYKSMQEFTTDDCAALTQDNGSNGDSIYTTLVDERDGNEYKVAKLKDGKCWMIENLRIGGEQPIEISSENSDMTSGSYAIPASNRSTFSVGSSGWSSNPNNNAAYEDSTYGGYYTWNTATAGTGSSVTSNGGNATGSICPKGWKLPTSGSSSSGDFADLVNAYGGNNSTGSTNLRHTPVPGFTYAGYIYYPDGSLYDQGGDGFYWSSTSYNSTDAYYLYLGSSLANPANYYSRVGGYSVRCLAREKEKTMQTVNDWKSELTEEQPVEAVDERDGNKYKVAKLKDGKIWMVENLRLGGSNPIPLTPADSDVSDNSFTLPASSTSGFSSYDVANVYVPTADSGNVKKEYGGYYTWYAATAGTGTTSLSRNQIASSSICPKGWRLPKGNSNGEFQALYSQYNSADLMLNGAPHFLLAGLYVSSSPSSPGYTGYYWSSTAYGYDLGYYGAYYLHLVSSSVSPAYNNSHRYGCSVRCVAAQ